MSNAAERFYQRGHTASSQGAGAAIAPSHEAVAELSSPSHRYYCAYRFLQEHPGLHVTELGFGLPRYVGALSQLTSKYVICDIVNRAETVKLPPNVNFRQTDLSEDFPFQDQAFDCTIAMMIIEHLFDPFHSFRELSRITKLGGKVFVNLPNIGSIRCRLQLLAGNMPVTSSQDWFEKREWDGNHLHYFTVADVKRLASISNLRLDAIHPVGKQLYIKRLSPALFCHEISFEFSRI